MLAVLIVNFNTLQATCECLDALLCDVTVPSRIYVLDNGSSSDEGERLTERAAKSPERIRVSLSKENLGFAGGNNALIAYALADQKIDNILLMNSDTVPGAGCAAAMLAKLDANRRVEMVAACMLSRSTGEIDSLGITLYRSTLASNRMHPEDPLLGPSGGCALYSRRLLEDLHNVHGAWFDTDFFCYAEDTDLAIRARWLGYEAAFAGDAKVLHTGSLSSGGADNAFVLYHGIRNSIWTLAKTAPAGWLLRSIPFFIVLHFGICLRHLRRGQFRVVWRLYRDAARGLPRMLKKRSVISASRRVAIGKFNSWVAPRFYEKNFLRRAWRELFFGRNVTPRT